MELIKKILHWFSKEKCYDTMEDLGIAAMGCCKGVVGGDKTTNYISYGCIDCPHYVCIDEDGE